MRVATTLTAGISHRPGITLIEVILGLAIFMMALVALGQLANIGTNDALDATAQSDGARLAQSKMAEVEAGAVPLTGGAGGTFDEEPAWSWSVDATQTGPPNLYNVVVTVSRERAGTKFEVKLAQLVFDPLQMGTAGEVPKPTATTTTTTTK